MKTETRKLLIRTAIFMSVLLVFLGSLGAVKYLQVQNAMALMNSSVQPRVAVEVATATVTDWLPRIAAVGSLTARTGIDVTAETGGVVEEIYFQSGQRVEKGQLLIGLNDDVEQAELGVLQEQLELAQTVFARSKNMFQKKAISESEYDEAEANLQIIEASIVETKARIAKKAIKAPFSGVLGIRRVDPGQYVAPGDSLVALQDSALLYVDFSVPEKHMADIASGLEVEIHTSAYPETPFRAVVSAIEARVDEATRNIRIRASLANEEYLLRPGMYADVSLILDKPARRVVVPATSIVFSTFGDALYTVVESDKENLVAEYTQVTTGERRGDMVEILSGLDGGERVVQAGTNKLRNGTPLLIRTDKGLSE